MALICQLITIALSALGISNALILNLGPIYIMIALTFVLYLPDLYKKWTKDGGMGAILPITGLVAGLADAISANRNKGMPDKEATKKGVISTGVVLLNGIIAAFVLALIFTLIR